MAFRQPKQLKNKWYAGLTLYQQHDTSMRQASVLLGTTTEGSVDADNLTISGDDRVGMTIRSANSGSSRIYFSDGTTGAAEYVGYITYDHSDNHMRFGTAAAEQMRIDASGEVTMPSQPAFHVTKNAAQNNIPINTVTTILFQTEAYDVGSNFASSIFTAPVSGKYFLSANVRIDNVDKDSAHDDFQILTSNRSYKNIYDVGVLASDPAHWTYQMTVVADMDAGDTARCTFFQTGGTAQADIIDDAGRTFFCGILIVINNKGEITLS